MQGGSPGGRAAGRHGPPRGPPGGARPREDGRALPGGRQALAEEVLRFQQQVAGLRGELRSQEARWSAALRSLQTQIDALKERSPGLRGPDARQPMASRRPRKTSDTLVLESASGRISPLLADEEARTAPAGWKSQSAPLLGHRQAPRRATPSQAAHLSGRSLPKSRGRKPTGPAAHRVLLSEDGPTAQPRDARSPPSPAPDGPSLARAQTEARASPSTHPPVDTEPQSLPGEPASSPNTSQPRGTETEKKEEGDSRHPDSKVDEARGAGSEVTEREAGARTTALRCFDRDVEKILPGQRVVYYYASAQTTRTTHPSEQQVLRFPSRPTEKSHPDGSREILFRDGTVRRLRDGREETVFPDGTSVSVERNGDKTIVLSNGQRDIHTAQFERREYPDGTVKTVYRDGRQETKDALGRVRVRDQAGSIILGHK